MNVGWKCSHCDFESRNMPGASDEVMDHIRTEHPEEYSEGTFSLQGIKYVLNDADVDLLRVSAAFIIEQTEKAGFEQVNRILAEMEPYSEWNIRITPVQ